MVYNSFYEILFTLIIIYTSACDNDVAVDGVRFITIDNKCIDRTFFLSFGLLFLFILKLYGVHRCYNLIILFSEILT
jgi:hypothetical protein